MMAPDSAEAYDHCVTGVHARLRNAMLGYKPGILLPIARLSPLAKNFVVERYVLRQIELVNDQSHMRGITSYTLE